MKIYSKSFLTVILLGFLILNGCSNGLNKSENTSIIKNTYEDSHMGKEKVNSNTLNEELGEIFPYEFTKEETELLQLLDKNNDIRIISFQAPKGTKAIEVKTAILNEEKEWVDEQAVSLLLDDGTGNPILSGEIVIEIQEDNRLKIIIEAMGRGIFYSHVDESLLNKKFIASFTSIIRTGKSNYKSRNTCFYGFL